MSNADQQVTLIDDETPEEGDGGKASSRRSTSKDKAVQSFKLVGASGERKTITIHHGEGKLGASAAFVAVNGHAVQIPRGVKVSVPVEIVAALDNAIQIVYERVDNEMVPREVRRFPYSEH